MKIAVTGAFSYSGKYITRRLLGRGADVITLTNHPNRPDPFNGRVSAFPLSFTDTPSLTSSLRGVEILVNTYWVRFDKATNTQPAAVENTRCLVAAAVSAGVKRIVHISITNPSPDSPLPYFWGKAANENTVKDSGLSYAILRPTVLFGAEDILINNIAWLLRRFPVFALPGDGTYRLQPVFVDDLAALAVEAVFERGDSTRDAVGPDIFTFREMVELIGSNVGVNRRFLQTPPRLALIAAQLLGVLLRDVMLTPEEMKGLMANLLVSKNPPLCKTRLGDWLEENRATVGMNYASELKRHFD
jgi:NADH dehydrogenase